MRTRAPLPGDPRETVPAAALPQETPLAVDESAASAPPTRPTGEAAAAVLAVGFGLLALGVANLLAAAFGVFEEALAVAGRYLVPGGVQLGPYAGKELVALVAWLGGWAVLHWRLARRQVSLMATAGIFLATLVLATLLLWPPILYSVVRLLR